MIPFNKPYCSGREQKYIDEVCHSTTMSGNGDFTKKCHKFFDLAYVAASDGEYPTCDACGGMIKPDVVLYEEGLDNEVINGAVSAISRADVLIIGGTSLVVYPAAGLIDYYRGNKLVLINRSTTPRDGIANLIINDSIGKVFSQI